MKLCKCGCGEEPPIIQRAGNGFKTGDQLDFVNKAHWYRWRRRQQRVERPKKEIPEQVYHISHINGFIV